MADDEKTAPRKAASTRRSAPSKTSTSKTSAPKTSAPKTESPRASEPETHSSNRRPSPKKGWEIAREGARQLQQLTGNEVEGITGMSRTDDGWQVQVDVLELRRVPNTTDVLATYDVDVDAEGDLIGYHRRGRYVRGEVGDGR